MNKRLFTFGCSFTNYRWPTWADILGQEYNCFENWGQNGAGNHFILYSLTEAIRRRGINKKDTVAIMFSTFAREDRFVAGHWLTMGSVYNSAYPKEFVDNFTDPDGYLITNLSVIDAVRRILDGIGCQYELFSMATFDIDGPNLTKIFNFKKTIEDQTIGLYQDVIDQINPSMYEVVFNEDWHSRDSVVIPVARKEAAVLLQKRYKDCAGKDWPQFDDFMAGQTNGITKEIMAEIDQQFDFVAWRDRIVTLRQDHHPLPMEHYEYLEKLGFELTDKQQQFARTWNETVLTQEQINFKSKPLDRF
jgi:hypothetical protein